MKILRDFKCMTCKKVSEKYVKTDIKYVVCECGQQAFRMIGMPHVALDGTDPAYPSAYDHWANIREQRRDKAAKSGYYADR